MNNREPWEWEDPPECRKCGDFLEFEPDFDRDEDGWVYKCGSWSCPTCSKQKTQTEETEDDEQLD